MKGADRQRETDLNRIESPYNYKQNVRKKEDFGCENKRFWQDEHISTSRTIIMFNYCTVLLCLLHNRLSL